MELPEIEQLVGEVENRVERLRSLYDQYFMGIERIEPQIARKDVERRIQLLRKTQIRNTAIRFRFQNTLLRYNTFSAHWMRICRQIEDGTYKHHLRKAKERFGPGATREQEKRPTGLEFGDTEPPPAPPVFDLGEDLDVEVDFDDGVDAPDVRAALRSYSIPQEAMAHSVAGRALSAMRGGGPSVPAPRESERNLNHSTDPAPPLFPSAPPATKTAPSPARSGAPPLPNRASAPGSPSRAPPPLPAAAQHANASKTVPPPLPPRAAGGIPAANIRINPQPKLPVTARPAPPPPNPAAATARPAPPPPNPAAATARPAPPSPAAIRTAPAPAPSPAVASARPAPPAARVAPKPTAASAPGDDRDRQIYAKFVETRRSLGESTASITMDGMAKSMRDSREKLRQKHPGKAVDFEVQVKDGKTVLKPILK